MIQHNCIGEMSAIPTAAPTAEETRLVVPGISPGTRAPKGRAIAGAHRWPDFIMHSPGMSEDGGYPQTDSTGKFQ